MIKLLKKLLPERLRSVLRSYRFRWPPALLCFLPGSSRQFGPPRQRALLGDYFSQSPDALREVIPAHPIRLARPVIYGEFPSRFLTGHLETAAPGRLFHLQNARLLGPEGWIVTHDDIWLADAGFEASDPSKPVADYEIYHSRRGQAKPLRHLPGRTLSIASDFAIGGFGHFLHDSLARLAIISHADLSMDDFDWLYIPHIESPTTRHLIDSLPLPRERILTYDPQHDLHCEQLTATAFPGHPGHLSPPYLDYLRKTFSPRPVRQNRRIHLSRRGSRRNYMNTVEVDTLLNARGFEEIVPHRDNDILQKTAEAAFVFSLEGANFFNALFCPAGSRILLGFPDRLPHNIPYALSMCGAAHHELHVMAARSLGPPEGDGGDADVHIDPVLLARALDAMGAYPV